MKVKLKEKDHHTSTRVVSWKTQKLNISEKGDISFLERFFITNHKLQSSSLRKICPVRYFKVTLFLPWKYFARQSNTA